MPSHSNSQAWGPDQEDSLFSRKLEPEEVAWVRDLAGHLGFQLYQRALQELLVQAFNQLRSSRDQATLLRSQGECDAFEKALEIPLKLTQS